MMFMYEKQNTLVYVIEKEALSRKMNIFPFLMFLGMIYQSSKMTHCEGSVICKNNQCSTSFHTYKANITKMLQRLKNVLESF